MKTPNTPLAWEHWADWITAAIAGKARRLYPDDIKARAAWFDAQIDALPKPWEPAYPAVAAWLGLVSDATK